MAGRFRSVLVVEGDSAMREMLVAQLEGEGIRAHPAASAAEALTTLADEPVSAVLAALELPDRDGLALLAELRRRGAGTPLVLMTCFGSPEAERRARAAGARGCLVKPFDPDQLFAALALAFAR
jgi:DNA-binding response OmpR family regulator